MHEKKTLILMIARILERHSDEEHHLTQQEILRLLEAEYGVSCDRRSVRSNIEALTSMGYDIPYDEGYFLASRSLDEAELRMLIDSVLFSQVIPASAAKRLIRKLCDMGSRYFRPKIGHIAVAGELQRSDNKQVMYSIDAIHDAISADRKISFFYTSYGRDLKPHPRREEPLVVSPYQMFTKNRWYYLAGCLEGVEELYHFRIDRMVRVALLEDRRRPLDTLPGREHGLDLPRHLAEHIYMFGGASVPVRLAVQEDHLDDVVDWFGTGIRIMGEREGRLEVRVVANRQALFYWAIQYGLYVEVLDPPELREEIARALRSMAERYAQEADDTRPIRSTGSCIPD